MSVSMLTVVLVSANVLGATMAVPQIVKIVRTRLFTGVSLTWATLSATVNAGWGWYGLGVGDLGIVPVSVVSVVVYVAIAVMLLRSAPAVPTRAIGAGLLVTASIVGAVVVGGWSAAGVVLGVLYAVQLSPAVVAVYRSVDVAGVSVATWTIAFAEAGLWGVYGWVRSDVGLLALSASGMLMAGLVLARLAWQNRRRIQFAVGSMRPAIA